MKLQYKVVDTSVLLTDPENVLYGFEPKKSGVKTVVVLPMGVLYEVDHFKHEHDTERGAQARQFAKTLDGISSSFGGSLASGIKLSDGYLLQSGYGIEEKLGLPGDILRKDDTDRRNIKICQYLKREKRDVELVTFDIAQRDIARAVGITASGWKQYEDKLKVEKPYKGWRRLPQLSGDVLSQFYDQKGMPLSVLEASLEGRVDLKDDPLIPNEFLYTEDGPGFIGKFNGKRIIPLDCYDKDTARVKSRNTHQTFAMDGLRDPRIELMFLIGKAGSGKTFLTQEAGVDQIFRPGSLNLSGFQSMTWTRPIMSHRDEEQLGFLPGDEGEKQEPWMKNIVEPFNLACGMHKIEQDVRTSLLNGPEDERKVHFELVQYMRGRSFPHTYWTISEAQNLSLSSFKTILTRPGDGTKLVIEGDPTQHDRDDRSGYPNPLLYYANMMKGDPKTAIVYLEEVERSDLVKRVLERLDHKNK